MRRFFMRRKSKGLKDSPDEEDLDDLRLETSGQEDIDPNEATQDAENVLETLIHEQPAKVGKKNGKNKNKKDKIAAKNVQNGQEKAVKGIKKDKIVVESKQEGLDNVGKGKKKVGKGKKEEIVVAQVVESNRNSARKSVKKGDKANAASEDNKRISKKGMKGSKVDNEKEKIATSVNVEEEEEDLDSEGDDNEEGAENELDAQVKKIIKDYCVKTAIATLTANGTMAVPGVGTVTALLFGVAASAGLLNKLQTDMVDDIAAVYNIKLKDHEKHRVMLLLAGGAKVSTAVSKVAMSKMGKQVATQALSSGKFAAFIPLVGPVGTAAASMGGTYIVGKRAQKYFEGGEENLKLSWSDSVKKIAGVESLDQKVLVKWTRQSVSLVAGKMRNASKAVFKRALNSLY